MLGLRDTGNAPTEHSVRGRWRIENGLRVTPLPLRHSTFGMSDVEVKTFEFCHFFQGRGQTAMTALTLTEAILKHD